MTKNWLTFIYELISLGYCDWFHFSWFCINIMRLILNIKIILNLQLWSDERVLETKKPIKIFFLEFLLNIRCNLMISRYDVSEMIEWRHFGRNLKYYCMHIWNYIYGTAWHILNERRLDVIKLCSSDQKS